MKRIFISYRRQDTAAIAGRIYDRLAQEAGRDFVFKDVDTIQPGDDFVVILQDWVNSCDVLLVLIGSVWVHVVDEDGQKRLDDPNDFVRIEVEAGLKRQDVRVIPVLYNARMPKADQLPESLQLLVRKNAINVRDDPDFHTDMARLITKIRTDSDTTVGFNSTSVSSPAQTSPAKSEPPQSQVTQVSVLPPGSKFRAASLEAKSARSDARLVVRRGPKPNQFYELTKDMIMLGRDITNDIVIKDSAVSRQHARFTRTANGLILFDVGSTEGTYVNGQRLTMEILLKDGDVIEIGETVTLDYEAPLSPQDSYKPPAAIPYMPSAAKSDSLFRLVVRRGPQPNQIYELNKDIISVGRDISNDIMISDIELSRYHMRFTRGSTGFTLEDLGSTNGTFVNGQRLVGAKPLTDGDMIGLGETVTLGYELVKK